MNEFSFYRTADCVSRLLISQFEHKHVGNILELGAGSGSLLNAAIERWSEKQITASEINPRHCINLSSRYPQIKLLEGDSLNLLKNKLANVCSFDLAICNPPYIKFDTTNEYENLLAQAGFHRCRKMKKIPADILFVAKNILLLKPQGEMGVIVPDSLMTGKQYECFRKDLISHHCLLKVIQLPERIFSDTDALTHIILIKKCKDNNNALKIEEANIRGEVINQLFIKKRLAVKRADYKYWSWFQSNSNKNHLTLQEIGAIAKRGSHTHKELRENLKHYFHTTKYKEYGNFIIGDYVKELPGYRCAAKGDILIARVGKRCIGNIAMVKSGFIPISDCVYRLRVSLKYRKKIMDAMLSKRGQEWFEANAHGVCSQVISLSDLYDFEI